MATNMKSFSFLHASSFVFANQKVRYANTKLERHWLLEASGE